MDWAGLDHDEGPFFQTQALRPLQGSDRGTAGRAAKPIAATAARRNSSRCARSRLRAARSRATTAVGASAPTRSRVSRRSCASRIRSIGEVVVDDVVHGRVVFQNCRARRSDHRAIRRHAHLQFLRRGRRHGHADHACDSGRRSSEQHAATVEHAARAWGSGRRSTRICP